MSILDSIIQFCYFANVRMRSQSFTLTSALHPHNSVVLHNTSAHFVRQEPKMFPFQRIIHIIKSKRTSQCRCSTAYSENGTAMHYWQNLENFIQLFAGVKIIIWYKATCDALYNHFFCVSILTGNLVTNRFEMDKLWHIMTFLII